MNDNKKTASLFKTRLFETKRNKTHFGKISISHPIVASAPPIPCKSVIISTRAATHSTPPCTLE
jgi:hypothetical protein